MQDTIKKNKKTAPIVCALIVIAVLGVYLAVMLYGMLSETMVPMVVYLILGVYSAVIIAVMLGVIAALRQRLAEIEGGEEDAARQY